MDITVKDGIAILIFTTPREQREIETIANKLDKSPEEYIREIIAYEVNKDIRLLK